MKIDVIKFLSFIISKLSNNKLYFDKVKNLYKRRPQNYIHIGDLLTPLDGKMTGGQYIIASRMLDIKLARKAKPYYWWIYINELYYNKPVTKEEITKFNVDFDIIIESLDKNGYNTFYGDSCSIYQNPVIINNGTHRIAYLSLYYPNSYITYNIDNVIWFDKDGKNFWSEKGMTNNKQKLLENQFKKIIHNNVRTYLFGYCKTEIFEIVQNVINNYGSIFEIVLFKNRNEEFAGFHFYLNKQHLYIENFKIFSVYCNEIITKISAKLDYNWGQIAHSVTESITMECNLQSDIKRCLEFKNYT